MVTLLVDHTQLEIVLSGAERLMAVRRHSIRIDREQIAKVQLTDEPWTWIRGVRAPGTHVPGLLAWGTWRTTNGADFLGLRQRSLPGVVIDLNGHDHFQRIVLTTAHGPRLADALGTA